MSYCTNAQVASEFKDMTFGAATTVTDTEVDRFIAEADALIDAKVGTKYVVPVTGTTSLIIVRTISLWLVADRVKKIIEVKGTESDKIQIPAKTDWAKAWALLADIVKGDLLLSDSTLKTSADGVRSYASDHCVRRTFDVSKQQW